MRVSALWWHRQRTSWARWELRWKTRRAIWLNDCRGLHPRCSRRLSARSFHLSLHVKVRNSKRDCSASIHMTSATSSMKASASRTCRSCSTRTPSNSAKYSKKRNLLKLPKRMPCAPKNYKVKALLTMTVNRPSKRWTRTTNSKTCSPTQSQCFNCLASSSSINWRNIRRAPTLSKSRSRT